MHDITVFRQACIGALSEGEKVEADNGYIGEGVYISTPNEFNPKDEEKMKDLARSRHETVNGRNKIFSVLAKDFRHDTTFHSPCFRACCVVTQINIETDSPPFAVNYNDKYLKEKKE